MDLMTFDTMSYGQIKHRVFIRNHPVVQGSYSSKVCPYSLADDVQLNLSGYSKFISCSAFSLKDFAAVFRSSSSILTSKHT